MTTKMLANGAGELQGIVMVTEDTADSTPQRGLKLINVYHYDYNNLTNSVPYDILLSDGSTDLRTGLGLGYPGPTGVHYIQHFHSASYINDSSLASPTVRRFSVIRSYVITYSAAGVPTVTNMANNADVGTDAYGATTYTARTSISGYNNDSTNFPVTRVNISVVSGAVYMRLYGSNSPNVNSMVYHNGLLKVWTVI